MESSLRPSLEKRRYMNLGSILHLHIVLRLLTLHCNRTAFLVAEQEREGGISNHVSPFAAVSDAGNLLTRAQFAIPTGERHAVSCGAYLL